MMNIPQNTAFVKPDFLLNSIKEFIHGHYAILSEIFFLHAVIQQSKRQSIMQKM